MLNRPVDSAIILLSQHHDALPLFHKKINTCIYKSSGKNGGIGAY